MNVSAEPPQSQVASPWENVQIQPVGAQQARHTLHSYFVTSPESPNGKWVVFFSSTDPAGERGELILLDRRSGEENVLVTGLLTEDAHRGACQQWVTDRFVVYHDGTDGRWTVSAVDVLTGETRMLAQDRQLGFGAQGHPWVPVYGQHWNPGEYRDLQLVHVETGEVQTPVTIGDVIDTYPEWIDNRFGTDDLCIFFPVMSPDGEKVFFKVARPGNGPSFRGGSVSDREGMIIFDLKTRSFIRLRKEWGHPSWHPNGNGILEKGNFLISLPEGEESRYSQTAPSNHPTYHPSGRCFATDADLRHREKDGAGKWGIFIGSCEVDRWWKIDDFRNDGGADSWRRNHPHPVFNAEGSRLYYNTNEGDWTRLRVASPVS
ncbi:biopolymer transporter Tol [Kiritimatiellota bacterium B12222]|nr:biopolymer transporter Tol [Kiritimatiellota bacterium B12222]